MQKADRDFINNPPPKVVLMYQAVVNMINDGCDINTMKVADITTQAGIGKGTAYEYFSTKEEIITKALTYDIQTHLQAMQNLANSPGRFEEKIKKMLDYGAKHYHEGKSFFMIMKIGFGAYDIADSLKLGLTEMKQENICKQFMILQDTIMEAGVRENVLREQNKEKQRMVFRAQLISYLIFLSAYFNKTEDNLSLEEAEQFIYDSIVKLLG